jgi:anti-anti-sigma factor
MGGYPNLGSCVILILGRAGGIRADPRSKQREDIVTLIKHVTKGEINIIAIDEVRLMDEVVLDQCYREIVDVLNKTEESYALLHFGRVTFMSSSALGMLIRVHKKCKEFKIALKLCNISPDIREVFKITGLEKVFDIHEDVDHAMNAFKKSGRLFFRKKAPDRYNVREDK